MKCDWARQFPAGLAWTLAKWSNLRVTPEERIQNVGYQIIRKVSHSVARAADRLQEIDQWEIQLQKLFF